MVDYEPLDLSEHRNGGLDSLGRGVTAEIGPRHFRGLPFDIGVDPSECFISLDGDSDPVTVPVGNSAYRVVFAHRLVSSEIDQGGPVGVHVADYVFTLKNGERHAVPIRERFEISSVPIDSFRGPSGLPFVAVTDGKHQMFHRSEGSWQEVGRRQSEYLQATAKSYFLWSWSNPEPDVTVESIEIVPKGPAFVVAAITLGHVDEHPFARQGRREAKITITDPVLAATNRSTSTSKWTGETRHTPSHYPMTLTRASCPGITVALASSPTGRRAIHMQRSRRCRRRPCPSSRTARPWDRCRGEKSRGRERSRLPGSALNWLTEDATG